LVYGTDDCRASVVTGRYVARRYPTSDAGTFQRGARRVSHQSIFTRMTDERVVGQGAAREIGLAERFRFRSLRFGSIRRLRLIVDKTGGADGATDERGPGATPLRRYI
jgi:hypothetical protein